MDKQYKGELVVLSNLTAMRFASLLGISQAQVQKLALSRKWREERNKILDEHLRKMQKGLPK